MATTISVLIDAPVNKAFDYLFEGSISPGQRVRVDFAGKRVLGVVSGLPNTSSSRELKPVLSLLDDGGRWFSESDLLWLKEVANDCWVAWGEMVFAGLPVELRSGKWSEFIAEDKRAGDLKGEVEEFDRDLWDFRKFALDYLRSSEFGICLWIVESKYRVAELIKWVEKNLSLPVYGFYQGIGKNDLKEIVKAVNRGPVVLIGTRQLVFWPMMKGEVVFVEDAWLDVYRQEVMPKYDLSSVVRRRMAHSGGKAFLHLVGPNSDCEIVPVQAKEHPLLPAFVEEEFYKVSDAGGRVAVFVVGKGYARAIRCNACKQVQSCPRCDRPYTLVRQGGKDTLYCPSCSNSFPWNGRCLSCGSISVRLSSMGAERWERILRQRFRRPVPIFNKWLDLKERFDLVLLIGIDNIVSVDRFYSLPLASRFVANASRKTKKLYVRTRFVELADFSLAREKFLSLARELKLPPFGELVILSLRSESESEVKSKASSLAKRLQAVIRDIPNATMYGPYLPKEVKKRDKYYWQIDLFLPKDLPRHIRDELESVILSFRKRYRTITSVLAYN